MKPPFADASIQPDALSFQLQPGTDAGHGEPGRLLWKRCPCTRIVNQQVAGSAPSRHRRHSPSGPGQVTLVATRAGVMFGLQDEAAVVKNEPYQAQAVTEMKQTLADGSHIVQTTTATVARDSDGRTVRIQKLTTMGPWRSSGSSQGNSQTLTTIFDPVSKEHIDFTSDNKVAHVLPMPPLPPGAPGGVEPALTMAYAGQVSGTAQGGHGAGSSDVTSSEQRRGA